jgi:arginase
LSNIIGIMLALRRIGRFGLLFIDGHADFYQPETEPNGEVASMDLAIVSGRGPTVLRRRTNGDGKIGEAVPGMAGKVFGAGIDIRRRSL